MAARPATAAQSAQKAQRELEDLQLVLRARNGDDGAMDALLRSLERKNLSLKAYFAKEAKRNNFLMDRADEFFTNASAIAVLTMAGLLADRRTNDSAP